MNLHFPKPKQIVYCVFFQGEWEYPSLEKIFSTREKAQEWIDDGKYLNGYKLSEIAISEWTVE